MKRSIYLYYLPSCTLRTATVLKQNQQYCLIQITNMKVAPTQVFLYHSLTLLQPSELKFQTLIRP